MAGEFRPTVQDKAALEEFEQIQQKRRSGEYKDPIFYSNNQDTPLMAVPIQEVRDEVSANGDFPYEYFQDAAL